MASTETKCSVCTVCDIGCQLRIEAVGGEVSRVARMRTNSWLMSSVWHFKGFSGKLEKAQRPAQMSRTQPSDWRLDTAVEEHAAS